MSGHPYMDDGHVDAACIWLNVEHDVLTKVAERDFGIDEVKLTIAMQEPTRKFLVDAMGERGAEMFDEFSGANLPEGLSDAELASKMQNTFAEASLPLAFYLLASKWSVQRILQKAGATEDTFKSAWRETAARLVDLLGEDKAERAARMTYEFNEAATGVSR
jgi:hypothetical protein